MSEKPNKKKKKVGRPKKRGPKRKRKYISKKKLEKAGRVYVKKIYRYKIVSCRNGKKNGTVGKYETSKEAYAEFEKLKIQNSNILFKRETTTHNSIASSIDEYLLLEENESGQKENLMVRNEFGKFSKITTNVDDWVVIDKITKHIEETFMVYGYDPRSDRKTFRWIYDNLVIGGLNSRYDFIRIIVYKNKIIIKDDAGNMDVVFCKSEIDSTKFYNLLLKVAREDKIKQIIFCGAYNDLGEKRRKIEEELMKKTGMSKKKIQMPGNSFYVRHKKKET